MKPEALQHRKIGPLSDRAFRLWIGLITQADDKGRGLADPDQLRVLCWGYHRKVVIDDVSRALDELSRTGLIRRYTVDGVPYMDFPSWTDHQSIDRPKDSKLPAFTESSSNGRDDSRRIEADQGSRIKEGIKDQGREGKVRDEVATPRDPTPPVVAFQVNAEILGALNKSPRLGAVPKLRTPEFWRAEVRANPGVDFAPEILKAEAYLAAHPEKHYKHLAGYLHNWLGRADREPDV